MNKFNRMMKENSGFYKTTALCLDYFVKISNANPRIKKWASDNKKELKWIESWLRDNMVTGGHYAASYPKTKLLKNSATDYG